MTRRWTPQRFVKARRIRVALCAAAVAVAGVGAFAVTTRKVVALNINGETTQVTTYAMTVDRLLEEQGVDVKTHDLVQSTSGGNLANHAVVTVRSAYQTTIVIDGQEVPFWTVAESMDQLLGFFDSNEKDAAKVTVDVKNVYNQLTGGVVVNAKGPVTVIADGRRSVAPDGRLPAASILDSQGIVVGKEDRVSVEKDGDETILRVRRVTHGQETRVDPVPYATRTVVDPSLAPGQAVVRQEGQNGEVTRTYDVTYVDGVAESKKLTAETTTKIAIDRIVAVGPAAPAKGNEGSAAQSGGSGSAGGSTGSGAAGAGAEGTGAAGSSGHAGSSGNAGSTGGTTGSGSAGTTGNTGSTGTSGGSGSSGSTGATDSPATGGGATGDATGGSNTPAGARLWHPTVAQAKAYARGAAAQRGWTGAEWTALEDLFTKESGWLWYADNPYSDAYGIPQALPGSKMGPGWQDDGAVQIDWGLSYIAQRYGSPTKALSEWNRRDPHWY